LEDHNGDIWTSTNEGLNLFNPEERNFSRILLHSFDNPDTIHTYTVLFMDRLNNLWIGSHEKGLYKYNLESKEIVNFYAQADDETTISDNLIYSIIERKNGDIWVGTNNGLNKFNSIGNSFQRFFLDRENAKGINNNAVRVLLEDSEQRLWIGTGGGGINIYDDAGNSFSHLTTQDGLSSNFIMSLVEGDDGKIWAGTKYGISIINKTDFDIATLNKEDGISNMEFTLGSMKDAEGYIYFGSLGEISRFETANTFIQQSPPLVYLNSIEAGGTLVSGFSPYLPSNEIELEYRDSTYLSFEYIGLDYINPEKIKYSYILEGFDEEWINADKRRLALYTNLPPGKYTFRIRATNTDGVWNDDGFSQRIKIKPPFSGTWLAYSLYILAALGIIFLIISLFTNKIRKQKVFELKNAAENYEHLSDYLSQILSSMPSVLIVVDSKLKITRWNDRAERTTAILSENALGRDLFEVLPEIPVLNSDIQESLNSGNIFSDTRKIQDEKSDSEYEEITVFPITSRGQSEAVIRIENVTERMRLEEALVQSEKMLSVGGLAAGMAHEINNPLAGMMQSASIISNRLGKDFLNQSNINAADKAGITLEGLQTFMAERKISLMLDAMNESGKRIASIVDNMLSFAQKKDKNFLEHQLSELVDRTLELSYSDYNLKNQYDFKLITIKKDYCENLPAVICNGNRIQQVILNILRNGAQAMHKAEIKNPQFTIRTGFEADSRMVFIQIRDNGPGMDRDTQKRVFEPFFTTKAVGAGTGLGLSVSYFIITENHKGELFVESKHGKGAAFTIKLPVGD